MTKVLDKGHLILERHCGTDLDIVNAARQSFNQKSGWDTRTKDANGHFLLPNSQLAPKDAGLINFLIRERHGSPFEHTFFSFQVKAPIFVVREWMRHRAGHSFNEMSGRYTELQPEFYVPEALRRQLGKPGSYTFEEFVPKADLYDEQGVAGDHREGWDNYYSECWDAYQGLLEHGVAKEQARIVLPLGIYTHFAWSCNARSLMHWLSLRNTEQAQFEIRKYAEAVEAEFAKVLPVTYQAFIDNGRVSP